MCPLDDALPSLNDWKELYAAAIEFKKLEAWRWMYDADVFGVQNPANGEIGYCSIMGNLGEFFALGVYLGAEGLDCFLKIQAGKVSNDEALFVQKCLMASFEDRKFLDSRDMDLIKQLGLKFRGRNAWVSFRSYVPGYVPWYLNQAEATFLRIALEQACEVALMVRDRKLVLETVKKGHYLVRVPRTEGGRQVWQTETVKPSFVIKKPQQEALPAPIDELGLQRLKKNSPQPGTIWEVDLFLAPMPILERADRPFFPYLALFADHHSGFVLGVDALPPTDYRSRFQERFCELLEGLALVPEQVLVSRNDVHELIAPIAAKLGIKAKMVRRLKAIEEAKGSLFEHMR
jgi:hypothetical protein